MERSIIHLVAGYAPSGNAVREEVPVEHLGGGRYRVLQSPGVVLGVAADDVIELLPDEHFRVVTRGRTVCVQVYAPRLELDALYRVLTPQAEALEGRLDGRDAKGSMGVLVYTIPVDVGFAVIEVALEAVGTVDGAEWLYGNVYADDGVMLLRWWKGSDGESDS